MQEKLLEKRDILRDAVAFKKTPRIPYIAWVWQWKILDSDLNVTIEEASENYDIQEQVLREFLSRYHFDSIYERACIYNTKFTKSLPGLNARILEGNSLNNVDRVLVELNDIEEYQQNPTLYSWTHNGPKFHPDLTFGNIQDALAAQIEYADFCKKVEGIFRDEYGIPRMFEQPGKNILVPIEYVLFTLGGIKDFGISLRRYPEKVESLTALLRPTFEAQIEYSVNTPTSEDLVYDTTISYLVHSILNMKQFERFYYNDWKYAVDNIVSKDKSCLHMVEAEVIRFADYFNDLPKGKHCLHPEIEDVRDIRKVMPNLAIEGGMPVTLVGKASKERCLNFAKELVDTMGDGYILSQDKFMNYSYDGTRENMLALSEFVLNYKA